MVTMPEASVIVYECPGCGKTIEPGEDYVVAREYEAAPDFSLHLKQHVPAPKATRHFHVEHFRGHIGDYTYELVDEDELVDEEALR